MTPSRRDAIERAVAPLRARPASTGICTDFDGTLATIVDDPSTARLVDGAFDVLAALAERYALVAVLSGRPVAFLEALLPPRVVMSGVYGLEHVRGDDRRDHPEAPAWRAAVGRVAAAAATDGPPGMVVEPKGISLTLHYREHPERADEVVAFAARQAAHAGLAVQLARMSVELHPPVGVDKGTELRDLVVGLDGVLYVGDDVGDRPAFAALDALAAKGVDVVKAAVASAEAPAELLDAADVVVDGPAGVLELLRAL